MIGSVVTAPGRGATVAAPVPIWLLAAWAGACAHRSPPDQAPHELPRPAASAGATASAITPVTSDPARTDLHRIFDDYYEESLALDPVLATTLGDHRYDEHLANDLSEAYRARVAEMCHRLGARLEAIPRGGLSPEDDLSRQLLRRELTDRLLGLQFPDHLLALTHISGQPVDFPVMGSGGGVHPFQTSADYDHFLRRMDDFVAWMDAAIVSMRRGLATGVVLPRPVIDKLLPQLDAQIVDTAEKSIFFEPLRHFPAAVGERDRARLTVAYRARILDQLVPSYQRLRSFLGAEYGPHARTSLALESLPNGAAFYAYRVRTTTTTNQTPDQISRIGEAEVTRIEAAMEAVRKRAGHPGDLRSFARNLMRAPGGVTTRQGLLTAYEDLRQRVWNALPSRFGRLPHAPFQIRAIEAFREEAAPSQYQPPSPDGSRPGVFFVNTADIAKGKSMRVSETLFLHEAVPGHHMQIALQYENTSAPRFRRMLGYTAYVEGWALYAESLGQELGLFRDPAQELEHLGDEMLRAVRLVVDTGLHHRGWSRPQAVAYFNAHVISTSGDVEASAELEIDRYIAWPGQALAYKTGQLELEALRARAAQRLGATFDLRAFHDEILRHGPLPLDLLAERMDAWIAGSHRTTAAANVRLSSDPMNAR